VSHVATVVAKGARVISPRVRKAQILTFLNMMNKFDPATTGDILSLFGGLDALLRRGGTEELEDALHAAQAAMSMRSALLGARGGASPLLRATENLGSLLGLPLTGLADSGGTEVIAHALQAAMLTADPSSVVMGPATGVALALLGVTMDHADKVRTKRRASAVRRMLASPATYTPASSRARARGKARGRRAVSVSSSSGESEPEDGETLGSGSDSSNSNSDSKHTSDDEFVAGDDSESADESSGSDTVIDLDASPRVRRESRVEVESARRRSRSASRERAEGGDGDALGASGPGSVVAVAPGLDDSVEPGRVLSA